MCWRKPFCRKSFGMPDGQRLSPGQKPPEGAYGIDLPIEQISILNGKE
jgi:hypothetical protein